MNVTKTVKFLTIRELFQRTVALMSGASAAQQKAIMAAFDTIPTDKLSFWLEGDRRGYLRIGTQGVVQLYPNPIAAWSPDEFTAYLDKLREDKVAAVAQQANLTKMTTDPQVALAMVQSQEQVQKDMIDQQVADLVNQVIDMESV